MPPIPETSPLFLDELKKMMREDSRLLDCTGCIKEIRNRITHPKKYEESTTILKYSSEAREEVSNLCIWYLELCLLKLFDYEGIYRNRLYKLSLREGNNYDKVPWTL